MEEWIPDLGLVFVTSRFLKFFHFVLLWWVFPSETFSLKVFHNVRIVLNIIQAINALITISFSFLLKILNR